MEQSYEQFKCLLADLAETISTQAKKYPKLAEKLAEFDLTAQIRLADNRVFRWFHFEGGKLTSEEGDAPGASVELVFKTPGLALKTLRANRDHRTYVNGVKYNQI